ncbi:MAG: hypothetical protein ACK5Y2_02030 [Bdellovibrionales bacterium]
MNPQALLYLNVEVAQGAQALHHQVFEIRKTFRPLMASSVYKRFSSRDRVWRIEVVLAVEFSKEQDLVEMRDQVAALGGEVLMVEGELRVDPVLPLPHPRLLLDSFILKMASECAPYWEHRVKQQTLQALAQQNPAQDSAEFLTQGEGLINV